MSQNKRPSSRKDCVDEVVGRSSGKGRHLGRAGGGGVGVRGVQTERGRWNRM